MPLSTGAGLLIGGIISALGGAVSNTVGGIFQNRANAQLAKENRDFALEMWNKENEYNLPINQVKRYRDAGLNPALIANQISPGNTSAPTSFNNIGKDYSYIQRNGEMFNQAVSMISALKDLKIKDAQKENIEANTAQTLIGNKTYGDLKSTELAIQQERLKQFIENNAWLPKLNFQQYEKGRLGNYILQYNADFTPTFLANRANRETKDLAILDQSLKNQKMDYSINAIRRSLMANEMEFNREMIKNRLLGLRLQNNLLSSQGDKAAMENKYLPEFLQLRNKGSLYDVNYKSLQNMFKRAVMPFEIDKSKYESNIKRKEDADFYTNRYIKHLVDIIPF